MNKQEIYDACQGKISMTSIKKYSGDWVISGKYGMIENMGDYWDIWITGVHNGKTLRTEVVNLILARIKKHATHIDAHFNNEATAHCKDENSVAAVALLLKARKKKTMSPESLIKLAEGRKKSRQNES